MCEQKDGSGCCAEKHFYGGQAVIEGVMMRGPDKYAVAVRRADGEVVVAEKTLVAPTNLPKWMRVPLVRGNVALYDSVTLGWETLQFSADVLAQEERDRLAAEAPAVEEGAKGKKAPKAESQGISRMAMVLTSLASIAMAVCLFVLLPTYVVDWVLGKGVAGQTMPYMQSVGRNLFEGCIRLLVITGYISLVSLMPYIRRVFQYHGAEHATINCLEAGMKVTTEAVLGFSPLHPRCGTAFLLVVVLVKIIIGCFFGWPTPLIRGIIRVALIPLVAGIAYEVIRWAGRHRQSLLSRILAAPGMAMQVLTTRKPSADQVEVAIHALEAVAEEVELPEGMTRARRIGIPFGREVVEARAEG